MSLFELFVAICIIATLVALFAPAVSRARIPARKLECMNNLKQLALAVHSYASANEGRIPVLEDGQFGWPVALLPYLDHAALHRALKADPLTVEKEWQRSNAPQHIKVMTCLVDLSNSGQHVGLSYVVNAGWGRFHFDSKTDAVSESQPHTADVDWDRDGTVTEDERRLTRATGLFWRVHEDRFQLTLEDISESDGQTNTMMFTENTNARNWLSRKTFDIGVVVDQDRIVFEPDQEDRLSLNVKSANLGPFAIRSHSSMQSLPGHSPVPSSNHTGIINVAFSDGRVESVNVTIDPRVYLARMTWNGGRYGEDPKRNSEP